MFEFLKDITLSVEKLDKIAEKNNFMSNPFGKTVNQTFVWTENDTEKLFKNNK